jgi:hypothetical protein
MNTIDFIHERCELMPLWERATAGVQMLRDRSSTDLLYFDSVDISTQKFFDLIRAMLAFKGASDFASLVLRPDPFSYFHFHFGKYPGLYIVLSTPTMTSSSLGKKTLAAARRTVSGQTQNDMRSCRFPEIGSCTQTENGKWACYPALRISFHLHVISIRFFLILGKASRLLANELKQVST